MCGPRAGLGEINLPARQAGSSITPGKVNPVILEVVNQIAYEVIGNDVTVTFAAASTTSCSRIGANDYVQLVRASAASKVNR